jgi:uncharacterized HAD superfamily protein
MQFGIDVDSVVADTLGEMLSRINNHFGMNLCAEDVTDYYIDQWLKDLPDLAVLRDTWIWEDAFYNSLVPLPGAGEGVAALNALGPCYFITARPQSLHAVTSAWLAQHGFPAGLPVICAEDKAAVAVDLGLTHFVEDSPTQASALSETGLTVYLMDYGWNRHIPEGPCATANGNGRPGEVVRVRDWPHLLRLVGVSEPCGEAAAS